MSEATIHLRKTLCAMRWILLLQSAILTTESRKFLESETLQIEMIT